MAVAATGCASIVSGTNQPVTIETHQPDGQQIAGANCKLSNNKGTWFLTTPGSTTISRSFEDLAVLCEKESEPSGMLMVKSSTKAMAFGNILFGGLIGVGVDVATGAAYDYPAVVRVPMGVIKAPAGAGGAAGKPD
jgi:hypothetical protein